MSAANLCREFGWDKGQLLLVDRSPWAYVIRVTAVGEDHMLYRQLGESYRGSEWSKREGFEKCAFRLSELYVAEHGGSVTAIDRLPWEVPNDAV